MERRRLQLTSGASGDVKTDYGCRTCIFWIDNDSNSAFWTLLCLLATPIGSDFGPQLRVRVLPHPCICWHHLSVCLCVISAWHRLRIAEGTRRSSIFRWTLMSLTLITVHNRRHHFILNLAPREHVFFFSSLPLSKWNRVTSHASFISMKHRDTLKLTGINADKLRTLGMHVIYWYPLSCCFFFIWYALSSRGRERWREPSAVQCNLHDGVHSVKRQN